MRKLIVFAIGLAAFLAVGQRTADACGGLFCQNSAVSQAGERIVFTINDDGTVSALIDIRYTGSAPDFSWILPVPSAVTADDIAVVDGAESVFTELHRLTDVRVISPPQPDCAFNAFNDPTAGNSSEGGVEVFASGEVGPFGFDVIGSTDSGALTSWLRDHNYRVDEFMEPLIGVYVEEEFAFVAMRLLDGEESAAIRPVEITYRASEPAVPIRLTAVAANANMPVFIWIFADDQAVPANYERIEIDNAELTVVGSGGSNYTQLVQRRADALGGQAFITEFAGPATSLGFQNDYLRARRGTYLTRLATYLSPDEMTLDPVFEIESGHRDVSNVRDASQLDGIHSCERADASWFSLTGSDAINPFNKDGSVSALTPAPIAKPWRSWLLVVAALGFVGGFLVLVRRGAFSDPRPSDPTVRSVT